LALVTTEVNNQISVNNFNRFGSGTRLYFGNIVEFANMISKLGGEGFLVVQIHKPDGTIVYGISRRMGVFELTKETHDSHFGAVFTPYLSRERWAGPLSKKLNPSNMNHNKVKMPLQDIH